MTKLSNINRIVINDGKIGLHVPWSSTKKYNSVKKKFPENSGWDVNADEGVFIWIETSGDLNDYSMQIREMDFVGVNDEPNDPKGVLIEKEGIGTFTCEFKYVNEPGFLDKISCK